MSDPEFDGFIQEKAAKPSPKRFGIAAIVITLGFLSLPSFHSQRRSTCAVCRLDRTQHSFLGFSWSDSEENECSRWYAANVEPSHAHSWLKLPHCRRFGIPFIYGGYACYAGDGPLTGLSRAFQQEVYQHSPDRFEAKKRFLRLGQWDETCRPLWESMFDWEKAEFRGTWDEFAEKAKVRQEKEVP